MQITSKATFSLFPAPNPQPIHQMIKKLLVLLVFKSLQEKSNQYSLSAYYRGYGRLTVLNTTEDAMMSKTRFLPSRTNRQEKYATPTQGTFLPPPLSITTLSWDPPELPELPQQWPNGQDYSLSCLPGARTWWEVGPSANTNPTPDPAWPLESSVFSGPLAQNSDCRREEQLWLKASKMWTFSFAISETFWGKTLQKNTHLLGYY